MAKLKFGEENPMYELGVDHGVLYLDDTAVPWNGLVSVDESETTEVDTDYYFEGNRLYVSCVSGAFEAGVSAYTYPEVFAEYNGYGELDEYKRFGLSYRTEQANGHRLHLVYEAMVHDDVRSWTTISNQVSPSLFNWQIRASAVLVPGSSPSSHLIIEIPEGETTYQALEDALYGTETTEPRLPSPEEVVGLFESATRLRIIYHEDGSYTATGPDDMVSLLDDGRFVLNAPSVYFIDQDIFVVESY